MQNTTIEEAYKLLESNNDFNKLMGIELLEYENNRCRAKLPIRPEFLNTYKIVHGGVIFAFADTLGGVTAYMHGKPVVTLSANINYLAPARGDKDLYGVVTEVKYGSKIAVYRIEIFSNDVLSATVEANYFIQ